MRHPVSSFASRSWLLLVPSLKAGGAERVASVLANHWAASGCVVTLATFEEARHDAYALHPGVDRVVIAPGVRKDGGLGASARAVRRILALRALLRERQPGAAVGFMPPANVTLALAGIGLPGLVIGSERSHPPAVPIGAPREWIRAHAYRYLDAVVAQSRESDAWMRQHTRAREFAVLRNPVLWPMPKSEPLSDPAAALTPGRRVLLMAGRLSPEKQVDKGIAAFAELAGRFPLWDLVAVGEGPSRSALEHEARAAGLGDRVKFVGRVGNIGDWYARADLYLMTSRFEGMPNTLAEALAHGVPAISFDCDTGPRDLIRPEVDGLLVAQDDMAGLASALARAMADAGLRARWASRAGEIRERLSVARVAAQWEALAARLPRSAGRSA